MKSIKSLITTALLAAFLAVFFSALTPRGSCAEIDNTSPPPASNKERLPPGAIGWGNLLVPGLGATLSDQPLEGLKEASLEIGSFYGGTLLAPEGRFKIDGSVDLPPNGSIDKAASAQMLQQFGLKYHFYNTFYHYQQAAIEASDTDSEKHNPQPIYRGTWNDIWTAPFRWDNLKSPWTWPVILGGTIYLLYDYASSNVTQSNITLTPSGETLLATSQSVVVPFGSAIGEDLVFRGMMQREILGMTGSLPLAIGVQSALFSLLHENHVNAFAVGVYFGIETDELHGNLGPVMAAHFWLDLVDGFLTYLTVRRSQGETTPFNPPIVAQTMIHF